MKFEWDEVKRQANLKKHGVDFLDGMQVLSDAPVLEEDERRDYGEQRCMALGDCCGQLLVVVFTLRDSTFRIISVRRANVRERNKYEQRT